MTSKRLKIISVSAGVLALVVLILLQGGFLTTGKIAPGWLPPPAQAQPDAQKGGQRPTAQAIAAVWPQVQEAVGTVRPRTETRVEAQVAGRVLKVLVRPGEVVKEGQLLVVLEDQEYQARLEQARQGLSAAHAALDLAEREYGRLSRLLKTGAAPKRDVDRAKEALQQAQAARGRAVKQVEEAGISLSYTKVKAPEHGQVVKRLIEPGDLALPGRPLLILQTSGALRLEALVREGLIQKVRMGQEMEVEIPALGRGIKGKVEEIVPTADPATRTFLVKALLPDTEGLYSGMFGRLMIPVGKEKVVLAPEKAIRRVGQLEMVLVHHKDGWRQVYVTTGRRHQGMVEILSGLNGGETLALKAENDA
jgi:HlyD family secretion protein